MKRQCVWRCKF
ncbi:hypothetical protein QTU67_003624 [Vibrio cholerae]|nr:hypothetical protein [Vibrio cholerae]MCF8780939.1 hypothetical protein [Vibrio floridensis]MCO7025317.1 hypothetical protein [Vibrio paracholerae]EID7720901.1 hypothetical protein [Vibrio cholerae]EJL6416837.1 hypothetical protein [Vibrio cholerae]EJL6452847.1 hypothetical protein [Vibrio cholerae]